MKQQLLFEMAGFSGPDVKEVREAEGQETREDPATSENRAVSPLVNFSLREKCAHCGREIDASGCIIPDFDELGAFCSQACADLRFRLYLKNEA